MWQKAMDLSCFPQYLKKQKGPYTCNNSHIFQGILLRSLAPECEQLKTTVVPYSLYFLKRIWHIISVQNISDGIQLGHLLRISRRYNMKTSIGI